MSAVETLDRDGVTLRYVDRGRGDPPLVFVHGWCCDHRHFAPQIERFAADHRVVALDQRGFGESDRGAPPYTIEGFADDVASLCRAVDAARPVLIGHSMGGAICLAAAARHPELPRGLVLCDPAVFWPEPLLPRVDALVASFASPDYLARAREFIRGALFVETDDPALRDRVTEQMLATPQPVLHSAFANLHAFDETAAARACRVPVLCIDAAGSIVDRERFRAACPRVAFDRTPDVGHFHQLLAPEAVNGMIERFVAGLPR